MAATVSEEMVFYQLLEEVRKAKAISESQIETLTGLLGERFSNAYKTVEDGWVKKYLFHPSKRVIWVITGKEGNYQILPNINFCSCDDFYFRVVSNEVFLCYHLLAQKLAEALDKHVLVDSSDAEYESLMVGLRRVKAEKRLLSTETLENVRMVIAAILSEVGEQSTGQLLEEAKKNGFVLTLSHLARILVSDKRKRFKCKEGVWSLTKS